MSSKSNILNCRKQSINYTQDQITALNLISDFLQSQSQFFLLIGNAGTGKTTIAENIANYANAFMLAPTNAAVKRLRDKFGYIDNSRFSTIHSTLYGLPNPITNEFNHVLGLNRNTTYIIDECSMIDAKMLDDLLNSAIDKRCKLIFIGDDFQLEPVGQDPLLFEWDKYCDKFSEQWKFKLHEVKRNDGDILKVASHLRKSHVPYILNTNSECFSIVEGFSKNLSKCIKENKDYIVIVSTNADRIKYNRLIREYKYRTEFKNIINKDEKLISISNSHYPNGELFTPYEPQVLESMEVTINVGSKSNPIFKVINVHIIKYFTSNSKKAHLTVLVPDVILASLHSYQLLTSSKIYNHRMLTTNAPRSKFKRIWLNKISISTYGYATSAHKSQGNEWDHVFIDSNWLSHNWNKSRWLYTAITRAKKTIEIIQSKNFIIT